ncbi:MAG TPA: copper oxidase [Longimicrobiales bacterium]
MSRLLESASSRRQFLRASAAAVLPVAITACNQAEGRTGNGRKPAPAASGDASHTTATPAETHAPAAAPAAAKAPKMSADSIRAKADEMDRMHEAGIKAFPAKTAGKGNQVLQPKIVRGVKVYELTAKTVQWEVESGKFVEAWTYNGVVPGPQIRVREGDRVRIKVKNELEESTAVHFHGLEVPNDQDGVPFMTQPPIKPGETYTYEFTVPNAGSHMYHSHHNAAKQVGMGMLGAFIVEPKVPRPIEKVDVDYVMILNDGYHGFTLNGKGFPATEPLVAKLGQKLRIRYMNEGMMIHPMHLHGMHMTVIDKDGWPQPQPWKCDTINIAPGERWDVIVECNNPGTWAFHCHILTHAESQHGMFGMVTALIVQK